MNANTTKKSAAAAAATTKAVTVVKMSSKVRILTLREGLAAAIDNIKTVEHLLRDQKNVTGALAELGAIRAASATTLDITMKVKRVKKSADERAQQRAAKKFTRRQDKLVAWIIADGITAGRKASLKSGGPGAPVVHILTNPRVNLDGTIVMDVRDSAGDHAVDAMLYQPDFTAIKAATKAAKATK